MKKTTLQPGGKGRRINCEIGTDTYALLYIKWIRSTVQHGELYQYSAMTHSGKRT